MSDGCGWAEKLVGRGSRTAPDFRDAAEVDNRLDVITPGNCRAAVYRAPRRKDRFAGGKR